MAPPDEIIESTRVTEFEGNLWPCFVFPDHSVPDGLIDPRPTKQALPVLILKRHEFVWRNRDELTEFDPFVTMDFGGERNKAFKEALEYKNLDYYHNLTWNKQAAKNLELEDKLIVLDDSDEDTKPKPRKYFASTGDSSKNNTLLTKKRPFSSAFKRPGLPSPSPTPVKKGKPSLPFGEDDSDVELPHPSTFTPTPTKKPAPKPAVTPWKPSGKTFKIPADDYVTRKQIELMTKKGNGEPTLEKAKVIEPVKDPLKVNIYVGDEEKLFILDRAVIQKCPSIMKHISGDNKNGFEIRNATFKKFKPAAFESLEAWLKTADYIPRLIESDYPYLENVKSAGQFEEAAEAASVLWNIAHKLDLTELQELIYRKIEVQTPLATNSLLMMTRMVFWNSPKDADIDEKMRQMLRHNIATRLHEILEEEPLLFSRVVKSDTELANYIWDYQIKHPWEEAPEQLSEEDADDADDGDD